SRFFTSDWFMDTQRLILFVVFSFSALFLWERWQAEHRPPVPPTTAQQVAAPSMGVDAPVPAGAIPPAIPGVPVAAAAAAPPSEKVVIKTDLYTATVDTAGAVLSEI